MTRFRLTTLCFAVLPLLAASCSGSGEAAVPAVVGTWSYSLDTTDGVYTGTMTITGTSADALEGTFLSRTEGNRTYPMENIAFEESMLSFTVPHPSYGTLEGEAELAENGIMTGSLRVPGEGRFGMTAERATSDM